MKKQADPSTPSTEPGPAPDEGSTQAMPVQTPPRGKTADIPPTLLPQPDTQGSARPITSTRSPWLWPAVGIALLAAWAAIWLLWRDPGERAEEVPPQAASASAAPVPPELRPYMDQAKSGDPKAMHMIALMYWNGLNVRQDRVKGLDWYRKAAAAGSSAAKETLKTIEGK